MEIKEQTWQEHQAKNGNVEAEKDVKADKKRKAKRQSQETPSQRWIRQLLTNQTIT